jgi:hypothetical protein
MSSKPAFHELRTRQRLGYSVHLRSSSLQRQLGLVVGVQSPGTAPDAVVSAVRTWMAGFRGELQQLAQGKLDSHKQVGGACYGREIGASARMWLRVWNVQVTRVGPCSGGCFMCCCSGLPGCCAVWIWGCPGCLQQFVCGCVHIVLPGQHVWVPHEYARSLARHPPSALNPHLKAEKTDCTKVSN